MLKKLSSVLKNPALQSAFRAAIFSAALLAVYNYQSFLSVVVFVAVGFYFYLKPFSGANQYFLSFLIFLISSLFIIHYSLFNIHNSLFIILYSLIFGLIFFLFLGIKNLVFINRSPIYDFINNFLFFAIFIIFFMADKSSWFFVKYLIIFAAIFLLFREGSPTSVGSRTSRVLIPSALAFLVLQILWAVALLPIGFFNSAALSLVVVLALKDLIVSHISGVLVRKVVLRNITMVAIFTLIIFAASKWQP